jgi:hypothetical protein
VKVGDTGDTTSSIAIVNEDRSLACQHIVRVNAIDGEVVGGGDPLRSGAEADDADESPIGGEELVASVELVGTLVLVVGRVPERVVLGGGDDLTTLDLEISQRV